jgi:hypothetical protein
MTATQVTSPSGRLTRYFTFRPCCLTAGAALASIERVSQLLEDLSKDGEGGLAPPIKSNDLLHNLQNIVIHGAALSRYFGPARQGHEARAEFLKRTLGVADDSPLRNRDLRNQIEHFDEKLDDYLLDNIFGYIFPGYVGPLPEIGASSHVFRAYYLNAGIFEMLGKRYEVEPLAHEIVRLHDRLVSCDVNGGRLRE